MRPIRRLFRRLALIDQRLARAATLLPALFLFVMMGAAQCDNTAVYGQYPGGTITIGAAGVTTSISGCSYAGEYSQVSGAIAGEQYSFSTTSGYVTVYQGSSNGTLLGFGPSPLTVTAGSAANMFAHWTTSAAPGCGTATNCYTTTVTRLAIPCTGTPAPGNTLSSTATGCNGTAFTLSLQNATPGSGVGYQWQTSSDGVLFANAPGASTGPTYSATQSADTYYQCIVTCGVNSGTSTAVFVPQGAVTDCYCIPPASTSGCTDGDVVARVILNTLDNTSGTGCPGGLLGYSDYTTSAPSGGNTFTTTLQAGSSYGCTVYAGQWSEHYAVWIDYNDDGVFQTPAERVGYTTTIVPGSGGVGVLGGSATFPINLACDPPLGDHRMRVRCMFGQASGATIDPCTNASSFFETEDYIITISAADPCPMPFALNATGVGGYGATLNWTAGCAETIWNVHVQAAGGGSPTTASDPGVTQPYTVSSLSPSTAYEFWVQADCGGNGTSTWAGPVAFSTIPAPACATTPSPVDGGFGCAGSSVTLTWAAVTYATGYNVYLDGNPVATNQAGTSYVAGILGLGAHTWSVTPVNEVGPAVGCPTWSFSVVSTPPGDTFADAIVIPTVPYVSTGNTQSAASCYTNAYTARGSRDKIWAITTTACTSTLTIGLCGTGDSYLSLVAADQTTLIQANDDTPPAGCSNGLNSSLTNVAVAPNTTYYIIMEAFGSASDITDVTLTVDADCFCSAPTAGVTGINDDCANTAFTMDVDVTSTGSSGSVNIAYSVNGGAPTVISGVGIGTTLIPTSGSFAQGDQVDVSVATSDGACVTELGVFTDNCPVQIICGTTIPVTHCYKNGDQKTFTFLADAPYETVTVSFVSGSMSTGDVIRAYSGTDNTGDPIFSLTGNFPSLLNVSGTSTGPALFIEIDSDGSGSCADGDPDASEWVFEAECTPGCVDPDGAVTVNENCSTITVAIFFEGDAPTTTLSYSVNGGTSVEMPGLNAGSDPTIGPFNPGDAVQIFLLHDGDAACNKNLGTWIIPAQTNPAQILISADPENICPGGSSQLSIGESLSGYTIQTCSSEFIDISASGTQVPGMVGDDSGHSISFPPFAFNGTTYTFGRVGNNGGLVLGATTGNLTFNNGALPSASVFAPGAGLFPYWDDMYPVAGVTKILTQQVGDVFIVQWEQSGHFIAVAGQTVTFQIQMELSTGIVRFVYEDVNFGGSHAIYDGGASATVGIQYNSGSALQYSYNSASLSDGQCIAFVPNASTPSIVSWSPSDFLDDPSAYNPVASGVTGTTVYTATMQALNGCTYTRSVTVNVSTPISGVSVTPNSPTICSNETTTLTATPVGGLAPYTYFWAPGGETTPSITVSGAGNYAAAIADACGTTEGSNIANVSVKDVPVVTASNNGPVCAGQDLELYGSSNLAGTTFQWNGPDGFSSTSEDPVISAAPASASGIYQLVATANGCSNSPAESTAAIVNEAPSVIATDYQACEGDNVQMSVTAGFGSMSVTISGTGFLDEMSWALTDASNTVISSGGNYGFGTTTTIAVNNPANGPFSFSIETQGTFNDNVASYIVQCNGVSLISGTVPGGGTFTQGGLACGGALVYAWSPATYLDDTSIANPLATGVMESTEYSVMVTGGGCTTTVPVMVDVTPLPAAPVTTNYNICTGGIVPAGEGLTATGPGPSAESANLAFPGAPFSSNGSVPTVLNLTVPALPPGSVVTSAALNLSTVVSINGSWRSEIRVALSGLYSQGPTQLSTLNSGGQIVPDPSILLPSFPSTGGTLTATLTETFNDGGTAIDATFGGISLMLNYTSPGVLWYDSAVGGSIVGGGSVFNPVSAGAVDALVPGIYHFFAEAMDNGCGSPERTEATFYVGDNNLELVVQADGVSTTTWEVYEQGNNNLVLSGSEVIIQHVGYSIPMCLPDGCYYLRVMDDAGDGITDGGYILRLFDGRRIIDNRYNFTDGFLSAISNNGGFCLPLGTPHLTDATCDRVGLSMGDVIQSIEDPLVSAQFGVGNQGDDGYEFWMYDPNGTYSYMFFHSHAYNGGFGGANALRATKAKINMFPDAPWYQLLNVRVRSRVNGVNGNWGSACRLIIGPAANGCPPTQLQPTAGPEFSCGVIRTADQFIYAQNVPGANLYEFRFRLASENTTIVRQSPTRALQLNWTGADALMTGATYQVDVRARRGQNWCYSGGLWGVTCDVTITTAIAGNGNQNLMVVEETEAPGLKMYPNPNRGDQVMISLYGIADDVLTVSVDFHDAFGKRVSANTIPVQDGFIRTNFDLKGEFAAGMYTVTVTAGETVYNERLVIQP